MTQDRGGGGSGENKPSAADIIRKIKSAKESTEAFDYRRASLAIHGHVCARCGREFAGKDLQLLTVHHKDGNHQNNPRDGRNWENLCVYCHEAEHSRELLGRYMVGAGPAAGEAPAVEAAKPAGMVSMADKLKAALEGGGDNKGKGRKK